MACTRFILVYIIWTTDRQMIEHLTLIESWWKTSWLFNTQYFTWLPWSCEFIQKLHMCKFKVFAKGIKRPSFPPSWPAYGYQTSNTYVCIWSGIWSFWSDNKFTDSQKSDYMDFGEAGLRSVSKQLANVSQQSCAKDRKFCKTFANISILNADQYHK